MENALEERTVSTSTRKLRKAKEAVRKANPDPVLEPQVVPCLLDLGIKCASSGRQASVTAEMTVPSSIHQNMQPRPPRMTSVERTRTRRRTRRKVIVPGHRAEDPTLLRVPKP